jgi:hypothetical protein
MKIASVIPRIFIISSLLVPIPVQAGFFSTIWSWISWPWSTTVEPIKKAVNPVKVVQEELEKKLKEFDRYDNDIQKLDARVGDTIMKVETRSPEKIVEESAKIRKNTTPEINIEKPQQGEKPDELNPTSKFFKLLWDLDEKNIEDFLKENNLDFNNIRCQEGSELPLEFAIRRLNKRLDSWVKFDSNIFKILCNAGALFSKISLEYQKKGLELGVSANSLYLVTQILNTCKSNTEY